MSRGNVSDSNPNKPNPNPGIGPQENKKPDTDQGAHDEGKKDKKKANPKPMNPDNPTVASTDGSKPILDAIKQADPGNVSGFIKKALDAMMMIRAIDSAGGGGGGGALGGLSGGGASAPVAAAAMGRGLLNAAILLQAAQQLGLRRILNALNAIMPEVIPQLDADDIAILDQAILAVITGTDVGCLCPVAMQNAQATAAAIASVQSISSVSTNQELAQAALTVASIGGSSLNLDPNSLALQIINAAVGTNINTTVNINNRVVSVRVIVNNSFISSQLENIPTFTGLEEQTIAEDEGVTVGNQLVNLIISNTLTATNFLALLRQTQQNIQNKSLKNALGTDLSGIMGQLMQLISQFASNIQDSQQDHQPRARLDTVAEALQKHSKILGLVKKKLDISDIFSSIGGASAFGSMGNISSMLGNISGALNGSGIASAMNLSNMIPGDTNITGVLSSILNTAQNPINLLNSSSINNLLTNGGGMLNQLNYGQVQSLLSAVPPNLAMSLLGQGTAMFSNMSSSEIATMLSTLPSSTLSQLTNGGGNFLNFHSQGSTFAEHTSDIAAALASVISTQSVGCSLMSVLPNGTTVIVGVIAEPTTPTNLSETII